MAKFYNVVPKWQKLAESGHTGTKGDICFLKWPFSQTENVSLRRLDYNKNLNEWSWKHSNVIMQTSISMKTWLWKACQWNNANEGMSVKSNQQLQTYKSKLMNASMPTNDVNRSIPMNMGQLK